MSIQSRVNKLKVGARDRFEVFTIDGDCLARVRTPRSTVCTCIVIADSGMREWRVRGVKNSGGKETGDGKANETMKERETNDLIYCRYYIINININIKKKKKKRLKLKG